MIKLIRLQCRIYFINRTFRSTLNYNHFYSHMDQKYDCNHGEICLKVNFIHKLSVTDIGCSTFWKYSVLHRCHMLEITDDLNVERIYSLTGQAYTLNALKHTRPKQQKIVHDWPVGKLKFWDLKSVLSFYTKIAVFYSIFRITQFRQTDDLWSYKLSVRCLAIPQI